MVILAEDIHDNTILSLALHLSISFVANFIGANVSDLCKLSEVAIEIVESLETN